MCESRPTHEMFLGLLDADAPGLRIELVQVAPEGEVARLELRMQHEVPGHGWVTQRRIRLAPGQIPALRSALNGMDADARAACPGEGHVSMGPLTLLAG